MRAVVVENFGGPEALEVRELPVPEPGPGQVRIRVAAAAVNPTDLLLRSGALADYVRHLRPPHVPGMDAAGTIDAVGEGVTFPVGTPVMAFANPFSATGGAQAEFVVVPQGQVAELPASVDLVDAAGLPMNALTADMALRMLDLPEGATIGVTGGAGALGGYAVQLAKHRGLWVIAEAAPSDVELLQELGADEVVPRSASLATQYRSVVPAGVDALIDAAVIGEPMLAAVRTGGQVVKCRPYDLPSERDITVHQVYVIEHPDMAGALRELSGLADKGVLTLRTADRLAPHEAGLAHQRLEDGGVRGRQLIVF